MTFTAVEFIFNLQDIILELKTNEVKKVARGQIIGIKRLDYMSKKTGKNIKGYSVHFGEESTDMIGLNVGSTYFDDERFKGLLSAVGGDLKKLIGRPCEVVYTRFGVDGINLINGQ